MSFKTAVECLKRELMPHQVLTDSLPIFPKTPFEKEKIEQHGRR
jgi:hypothetical protein